MDPTALQMPDAMTLQMILLVDLVVLGVAFKIVGCVVRAHTLHVNNLIYSQIVIENYRKNKNNVYKVSFQSMIQYFENSFVDVGLV